VRRLPAAILADSRSEARLAVEARHGRLDVRDDRLDLNDKERTSGCMPRQDVDRAALAVDLKRRLRDGNPAVCLELPKHRVDETCVIAVQQAIELLALPEDTNEQASSERLHDALGKGKAPSPRPASFQARDL